MPRNSELDVALLAGMKGLQAELFRCQRSGRRTFPRRVRTCYSAGPVSFPQPKDPENRAFSSSPWRKPGAGKGAFPRIWESWFRERLFPRLVTAMAQRDPAASQPPTADDLTPCAARRWILLYRLLFVSTPRTATCCRFTTAATTTHSLRKIRGGMSRGVWTRTMSSAPVRRYCNDPQDLFASSTKGDASLGVPPYNGGLFDDRAHELLARLALSDAVAELIDGLSRRLVGQERRWINYRDLSVQQLGSIYERLLEYRVVGDGAGPNPG